MTALATYEYRAVDKGGAERRGVVSATSEREAFRKVSAAGSTPLRLRRVREKRSGLGSFRGVKRRDIAQFAYQLAVLTEARIPLAEGVRGIAEQEPSARFRAILLDLAAKVQSGSSVSAALEEHRRVFGDVFVETVRAAERSGNLIKSLEHLAEMLERQAESSQQVKQALTYPVVVCIALTIAVIFLVVFVVPKFAAMFSARGVDLPLLTRALQALGLSIRQYWWAYAGGVACATFVARRAGRAPRVRAIADRFLHAAPGLRQVLVGLAVGRFSRILGLSLGSGLGLLESLDAAGRASGRPMLMTDVDRMIEQVRQGGRLSDVLRTCSYMPSFVRRMLAAGEESAELPRMCGIVSKHYERESSRLIKSAATALEPLLIATLTGVVLVVALAIFLPMWDMVGLVK